MVRIAALKRNPFQPWRTARLSRSMDRDQQTMQSEHQIPDLGRRNLLRDPGTSSLHSSTGPSARVSGRRPCVPRTQDGSSDTVRMTVVAAELQR